jgi:hypothetical protein
VKHVGAGDLLGIGRRLAAELDARQANGDLVALAQPRRLAKLQVVEKGAVAGAEVLGEEAVLAAEHARVTPRYRVSVDLDVAIATAPDHDLVIGQAPPAPHVCAGRIDEHQTAIA